MTSHKDPLDERIENFISRFRYTDTYSNGRGVIGTAQSLKGDLADELKLLILSEARRIGLRAIGGKYRIEDVEGARFKDRLVDTVVKVNLTKDIQRQRLSELTGQSNE